MKSRYQFKLIAPAVLFGIALSIPAFAQSNPNGNDANAPATAGQDMHQAGQELKQAGSDTAAAASDTFQGTKRAVKDTTITAEVKASLERDKNIPRAHDIHVNTVAGVVTLNGNVPTPEAAQHAAQLAEETKGVRSVNNQLMVISSSRTD
jgi:hyperosmotically inducible periplasmic protein